MQALVETIAYVTLLDPTPLGPLLEITPRALTDTLAAGGGEAKRAFEAMMPMKKIDIATINLRRDFGWPAISRQHTRD